MPVTSDGYIINNAGNGWRHKGDGEANLKANANAHAERVALSKLPASAVFMIVQDAFPCHACHKHFLGLSQAGQPIIVVVTANNGSYSADHGLGFTPDLPCIIYYLNGNASYHYPNRNVNPTTPPANFPAHPATAGYY